MYLQKIMVLNENIEINALLEFSQQQDELIVGHHQQMQQVLDNNRQLRTALVRSQATIAAQQAEIDAHQAEIVAQQAEIDALRKKVAQLKAEVQQDRAYMTFKTTGILPAHLMMVCRKLIQVGWIAKDTQPDDFCNLFSGKTNNTKVTWTGAVGKGMLVCLFNVMVQQSKIAVPENYSVTTILEAHFVDTSGTYLTGLNSSKHSPKHMPVIKECVDILQLEVDVD